MTKTTATTKTTTTNDKEDDNYRYLEMMDKGGQNRIRQRKD